MDTNELAWRFCEAMARCRAGMRPIGYQQPGRTSMKLTLRPMLAGDLRSYINYFKSWATTNPGVNFFAFGSVEKGIDFARSLPDFGEPNPSA